jgi:hypothetical protein
MAVRWGSDASSQHHGWAESGRIWCTSSHLHVLLQEFDGPTLVVLEGTMAFYELDCAGGLNHIFLPPAVEPQVSCNVLSSHARMVSAVNALCDDAAVVLLTAEVAVQLDTDKGIICKEPLPPMWEVRCSALLIPTELSIINHTHFGHLGKRKRA